MGLGHAGLALPTVEAPLPLERIRVSYHAAGSRRRGAAAAAVPPCHAGIGRGFMKRPRPLRPWRVDDGALRHLKGVPSHEAAGEWGEGRAVALRGLRGVAAAPVHVSVDGGVGVGVRAILTTGAAAVGGGGVLASVPMLQHNTHFLTIMSGKLMFVNLGFYETPFPTPHCQTHPKKEDKNNSNTKKEEEKKDATKQTKRPSFENHSQKQKRAGLRESPPLLLLM